VCAHAASKLQHEWIFFIFFGNFVEVVLIRKGLLMVVLVLALVIVLMVLVVVIVLHLDLFAVSVFFCCCNTLVRLLS